MWTFGLKHDNVCISVVGVNEVSTIIAHYDGKELSSNFKKRGRPPGPVCTNLTLHSYCFKLFYHITINFIPLIYILMCLF